MATFLVLFIIFTASLSIPCQAADPIGLPYLGGLGMTSLDGRTFYSHRDFYGRSHAQPFKDLDRLYLRPDSCDFSVRGQVDSETGDFGLCSTRLTDSLNVGLSATGMIDMYTRSKDKTFGPLIGGFIQHEKFVIMGYAVSGFADGSSGSMAAGISLSCRF